MHIDDVSVLCHGVLQGVVGQRLRYVKLRRAARIRLVADAVACRIYSRKSINRQRSCRPMVSRLVSLAVSSWDLPFGIRRS
jgi:hypothetical protein